MKTSNQMHLKGVKNEANWIGYIGKGTKLIGRELDLDPKKGQGDEWKSCDARSERGKG